MMLKYLCAVTLLVALVQAGSDDDKKGGDPKSQITVDEYKEEMEEYVKAISGVAENVGKVEEMAKEALADSTGGKWDGVGKAFEAMTGDIIKVFEDESERLVHLTLRLWERPEDFAEPDLCNAVYQLHQRKDDSYHLGLELAFAFIKDLGCFKSVFASVEEIPLDAMVAGKFPEYEALGVVYECFKRMHAVKRAGERFGKSLGALHEEVSGAEEKRALTRLYRLLSELKESE